MHKCTVNKASERHAKMMHDIGERRQESAGSVHLMEHGMQTQQLQYLVQEKNGK